MRDVIVSLGLSGAVAFASAFLVGSMAEVAGINGPAAAATWAAFGILAGCGYGVACLRLLRSAEYAPEWESDDETIDLRK